MTRNLTRSLAAAAAVAVLGLTSACSGGADTMSSDAPAAGSFDEGAVAERDAMDAPQPATDGLGADSNGAPGVNRTVISVRSVIKTGEIALVDDDLDATRAEIDGLLVSVGGIVDSERTTHDKGGDILRSTLVLRVPVDKFDNAMTGLAELAKVRHSDTASKDVTTQVIDVDERVQTLQNSLNRLQTYQRDAQNIDDLIRYEQQITQREAELQSLKSQQSYLADQTSMSTVTVYLSTPKAYVEPPSALDDAGFLSGLKSGWNALTSAVVVVLTVVGAVLPFAVVALLVGIPVWLLVRRTLRSHAAAPAPAGPPAPTPPPAT
ncbi:MAG: DUF4349 domain-containing protein [Nocardioides sp.]